MMTFSSLRGILTVTLIVLTAQLAEAQVKVLNLRTENLENPVGLGITVPRFSWQLEGKGRGIRQGAYEVEVLTTDGAARKAWSSGKVNSDSSVLVTYKGAPLQSATRYSWRVRVWDQGGKASAWSPSATFTTALLREGDWKAQWIGTDSVTEASRVSPLFRKTFRAGKKIRRALAFITAKGMYEAQLNGQRVGDAYLTPGWTSYQKRLQYQVYDVTGMLQPGTNAIGVTLGSGWYRGYIGFSGQHNYYGKDIALLFQLEITYTDGSKEQVLSDGSWKTSTGKILDSEIYHGETIDARKDKKGWAVAGYDDAGWQAVTMAKPYPHALVATYNEPIRKKESFRPVKVFRTPAGEQVIDFGQNLVGWVKLRASGKSGDTIRVTHAEVLDKQGNFYTTNLRSAKQLNTYVLAGGGMEEFEPHFTFQGFRYIRVEGYPGELKPEDFTAVALYSDMPPTGNFTSSHPLINQLQHNIQWGQRGNFLDVPTDCPQRDERLGWTGDAQVFFRTASFNFDVRNFFHKWLQDMALDQVDNGAIPFVIPNVLNKDASASAGWADAATIIPWQHYIAYGDKRVLEEQYPMMKKWVEYMRSKSEKDLWNKGFHFGDWLFYRPEDDNDGRSAITDKYLIAQSFYAHSTQLLLNAARVLGHTADVVAYTELLNRVKAAFLQEYVTPSGRLVSSSQTAYVLALHFDMLPEALRQQAADRLAENVKSYGDHLTTGFLGTPYLCEVLTRFGHQETAFRLLMQESYPSWLYPVKNGATTIWERWDGQKPDGSFQTPGMNSFNHYAYGAIGDWMYRTIAGMDTEAGQPGYKKIRIAPHTGGGLTQAKATLKTPYGLLSSEWNTDSTGTHYQVEIPANTTATLLLPGEAGAITEGGQPLEGSKGIEVSGVEQGKVQITLGSGKYAFRVNRN